MVQPDLMSIKNCLENVSLQAPRYVPVTKPTRSTQPCIPLGSLNRVLDLIGWDKGETVTCARWQVTLCDHMWHASFRSGEGSCITVICVYLYLYLITPDHNFSPDYSLFATHYTVETNC